MALFDFLVEMVFTMITFSFWGRLTAAFAGRPPYGGTLLPFRPIRFIECDDGAQEASMKLCNIVCTSYIRVSKTLRIFAFKFSIASSSLDFSYKYIHPFAKQNPLSN